MPASFVRLKVRAPGILNQIDQDIAVVIAPYTGGNLVVHRGPKDEMTVAWGSQVDYLEVGNPSYNMFMEELSNFPGTASVGKIPDQLRKHMHVRLATLEEVCHSVGLKPCPRDLREMFLCKRVKKCKGFKKDLDSKAADAIDYFKGIPSEIRDSILRRVVSYFS